MSDWRYKGKVASETIGFMWDDICEAFDGIKDALFMGHVILLFISMFWCAIMVAVQVKHGNYQNWHWWVWIPFVYLICAALGYVLLWIRSCHARAKKRLR